MTVEHAMKCAEADVRIGLAVEPETARVLLDELRRLIKPGWVLVPLEPTPEAVAAWWRVKNGHRYAGDPLPVSTSDDAAYRALVHAASGEEMKEPAFW